MAKSILELVAGSAEMLKQLTPAEGMGHQIDLRQQIIHDLNLALEGLPAMVTPLDHHDSTRELRRMTAEDVRRVVEHEPTWDECAEAMGVFQTLWPVLQKFQKV